MAESHSIAVNGMDDAILATRPVVEAKLKRVLWLLIVAMFSVVAVSFPILGLRVDVFSNPALLGICALYVATVWFYATVRRDPFIVMAMTTVGQLFLVLFGGLLLTYAASAVALPYCDAELFAIDNWLGFQRESYRQLIERVPGFSDVLDAAYLSIQPQTAAVPFILIVMKQVPRLQRFILAFGLALAATAFIAVFIPAMAAYLYVDLAPAGQAALPANQYSHIFTLEALRSGAMTTIPLNDLEGLITFPSFHTANAILFAWALWRVPYVWFAGLVVNVLMVASTPITGQHYVIDLVAGSAVAVAAILIARRVYAPARQAVAPTSL